VLVKEMQALGLDIKLAKRTALGEALGGTGTR
jgi:DNA-directed RNA polymerase subunit beta